MCKRVVHHMSTKFRHAPELSERNYSVNRGVPVCVTQR